MQFIDYKRSIMPGLLIITTCSSYGAYRWACHWHHMTRLSFCCPYCFQNRRLHLPSSLSGKSDSVTASCSYPRTKTSTLCVAYRGQRQRPPCRSQHRLGCLLGTQPWPYATSSRKVFSSRRIHRRFWQQQPFGDLSHLLDLAHAFALRWLSHPKNKTPELPS